MRYAMVIDTKNVLDAAIVLLPAKTKIVCLLAIAATG